MKTTLDWLTSAITSFVGFIPNLVAGVVILLIGWLIAYVLARVTRALARRLGFDRLMAKLGASSTDEPYAASRWLGSLVYLVVMLVAIMQAARAWRLGFLANGLAAVLAYLPHVLAAAIVFGVALYLGNWVRARFYARPTTTEPVVEGVAPARPRILPALVRAVIIAIGAFMALRELQIAPEIVNAAFILTLGAIAVAGALAFGLGGREVAGRIAQSWWERRSLLGPATPEGSTRHAEVPV
jgi:hypothetical protein